VTASIPITLVAAVGRNGVIGDDGRLPWRLASDLKRFKRMTLGKPLLMGRKTFESIGRPLPGRETIVLTRDTAYSPPGVHVAHTLDAALDLARARAAAMGAAEIVVAGGGELYAQTMPLAQRLDVTQVDLEPAGDARFPRIDEADWAVTERTRHDAAEGDEASFTVTCYERRTSGRPS
jgi:dihydrofolate reductase